MRSHRMILNSNESRLYIEEGDEIAASNDDGAVVNTHVSTIIADLAFADQEVCSVSQVVRTVDGSLALREEYWEDIDEPERTKLFPNMAELARFLWQRHAALDLVLLHRLGLLELTRGW